MEGKLLFELQEIKKLLQVIVSNQEQNKALTSQKIKINLDEYERILNRKRGTIGHS